MNHSCKTYLFVACGDRQREAEFEKQLAHIAGEGNIIKKKNGFAAGLNEKFDVDVNVMLRQTLKNFFGKERALKQLLNEFGGRATLEIVPNIACNSDLPSQILSLDNDIITFLYLTGAKHDLDYYLI